MDNDLVTIRKEVRRLKVYAFVMTVLFAAMVTAGFAQATRKEAFDEITARRILIVDANGKGRVLLASDYKKDNSAGIFFFNQEGTESGAINYNGKRDAAGKPEAYSILTMDQFKSDQIVALEYEQNGDEKRQGLTITDRPDVLSPQAKQLLNSLAQALQSATSDAEAQAIRRDYLSRMPAKEIRARRLFAGRELDGSSLVTLSDPDGRPRLRLQVDKAGKASIAFLDASGRMVHTLKP